MWPDTFPSAELDSLRELEELLGRAFTSPDPLAVLDSAAKDETLAPQTRQLLGGVDPRGVRLSWMIVVRLRFERITSGSMAAKRWFEADPAGFTEAFRGYVASTPPRHPFPTDEALEFHAFVQKAKAPTRSEDLGGSHSSSSSSFPV